MFVFENMTYPLVVLGLVDVVAVDELDWKMLTSFHRGQGGDGRLCLS